jgi:hypothetical protein
MFLTVHIQPQCLHPGKQINDVVGLACNTSGGVDQAPQLDRLVGGQTLNVDSKLQSTF